MAISYPISSPTAFGFASLQLGPMSNTARARNPWNFRDIVQVFDAQMWQGSLTLMPRDATDGRALAAWLTSLDGTKGSFLMGDPAAAQPLGSAATTPGAPVINGAGQTGQAVDLAGLPALATGWLLPGDYLQLGSGADAKLHMVVEQVDSDGAGEASATIWPKLRSSPTDNAVVTTDSPQGVFALQTGFNPWQVRQGLIYDGVTLQVAEVVS